MTLEELKGLEGQRLHVLFAEKVGGYSWRDTPEGPLLCADGSRYAKTCPPCEAREIIEGEDLDFEWSIEEIAEFAGSASNVNIRGAVNAILPTESVNAPDEVYAAAIFRMSRKDRMRVLIWAKELSNGDV